MEYQAKRYYKTYLTINSIIDSTLSTYFGGLCQSTQVQCVEYLCKFLANNKMDTFKTREVRQGWFYSNQLFTIWLCWYVRSRNGEFVKFSLLFSTKIRQLNFKGLPFGFLEDILIKYFSKPLHIKQIKRRKVGWSGIIPSSFLAIVLYALH